MAVLWSEDTKAGEWIPILLHGRQHDLGAVGTTERLSTGPHPLSRGVRLLRSVEPDDQWVLLSEPSSGVRVNGVPLALGIHVLRHRDEIVAAGAPDGSRRWFFSGECVVDVRPLPEEYAPATCPRCKRRISVGGPAVQCPNTSCGAWFHETPKSPCWSTEEYCGLCETPAVLVAGTRWSPEDL